MSSKPHLTYQMTYAKWWAHDHAIKTCKSHAREKWGVKKAINFRTPCILIMDLPQRQAAF